VTEFFQVTRQIAVAQSMEENELVWRVKDAFILILLLKSRVFHN